MPEPRPEFLTNPNLSLLIFGGKGGVGKTTCATASALDIARTRPERRVLLLSTDPAHSVADCLDGADLPANLRVIEFSAEAEHRAFMEANQEHLRSIAARGTFLDGGDIDRFVRLSLPGVDELMAFLRIARWIQEADFDVIVVDTAPSGHTLRLLEMSDLLSTWMEAIEALMAKHRYMAQMFAGGRARPDPTEDFLERLSSQIDGLTELLSDPARCRFVPVQLAEAMSTAETADILARLATLGVAAPELVVNRLVSTDAGPAFRSQLDAQAQTLAALDPAISGRTLWGAPLDAAELTGAARLARFASSLRPISHWLQPAPMTSAPSQGFLCDGTALIPSAPRGTGLLFFAGKGGVGKTTMACATAAHLAALGRRTLVVSTDPAHSLGDCLGLDLGDDPLVVAPCLRAVEIDAASEFEQLRDEYREELEEVLESMFASIDLSFDREAMERLLDLAPPGLDECMALLRILDQLDAVDDGGRPLYETIVIDTAPTGHLLRLLEMPQLIEGWLSCLFALFIKYDNIFRLPRLQARLISLSRGIKRLRTVITDDARCQVQVVTIPTEMALSECTDLVLSLRAMHVRVGTLFINLMLPEDAGTLARAVREREAAVAAKYAASFGSINTVRVYRCGDPRGIANLSRLGATLHGSNTAALPTRRAA